jgi:hypothetical protein
MEGFEHVWQCATVAVFANSAALFKLSKIPSEINPITSSNAAKDK